MPSPQLAQIIAEARIFAEESGAARGVFNVAMYRDALKETKYDLPSETDVRTVQIGDLKCFWVRAHKSGSGNRILYMHGGGLVIGGFHSHKGVAAWLSRYSDCDVLFPEYRLSPENPFPAAYEDTVAALRFIADNSMDGRATGSVIVGGDSAGAGVVMAALLQAEPECRARVAAAMLFCPMLNWHPQQSPALRQSEFRRLMAAAYTAAHDPADPAISAQLGDWSGIPPLLIQATFGDEFYPDAAAAFDLAQAARRSVLFDAWSDLPHVWHRFAPFLPEASEALCRAGAFAKTSFDKFQDTAVTSGGIR